MLDIPLRVRAERKSKVDEKDKKDKVIRMDRSYGSCTRSFDISGVDADKIKARYVDGVLRLTLPNWNSVSPKADAWKSNNPSKIARRCNASPGCSLYIS